MKSYFIQCKIITLLLHETTNRLFWQTDSTCKVSHKFEQTI